MPFSPIGTFACRALQEKLINYYGANAAEFKTMGSNALIKFLLSPQNTSGFIQITDTNQTIPGKKRAIAFLVDVPFCYDVCKIDGVLCNTARGEVGSASQEQVFDLSGPAFRPCDPDGNHTQLSFDEADLLKYCTETNTDYITRQIARFNKRFVEAIDKRIGELLLTLTGTNSEEAPITRIPFFINLTTGVQTLNPEAIWFLDQTYRDIGGEGQYALVGGKVLNKLMSFNKWSGLQDSGIDLSKIGDISPYTYYDRNLDSTLGVNSFFQLSPGAVQLVYFNEHKGDRRRVVTDLYTHSTFIDVGTGIEIDFEWSFDFKCKKWIYEPYIFLELAVAPAGGCGIELLKS